MLIKTVTMLGLRCMLIKTATMLEWWSVLFVEEPRVSGENDEKL